MHTCNHAYIYYMYMHMPRIHKFTHAYILIYIYIHMYRRIHPFIPTSILYIYRHMRACVYNFSERLNFMSSIVRWITDRPIRAYSQTWPLSRVYRCRSCEQLLAAMLPINWMGVSVSKTTARVQINSTLGLTLACGNQNNRFVMLYQQHGIL
jgi:hypothetical protein